MRFLTRDLVCQQAVELVTDYLENRLSRRDRRRFERHLAGCPNCTTYLEQIRQTISAAGHVEEDTLEPETREDLIDLFRRYSGETD
jgi:anti-sigma factor RsiW